MLSPDYRVSYISAIGQHVSVNLLTIIRSIRAEVCHMQQSISERSYGPDDGQKVDRYMLSY